MWIEYDLRFKDENGETYEKGMFNSDHIKWVQIEEHGGAYGKAIEMYYDGYDSKCIFMAADESAMEKVWLALYHAISGVSSTVAGIGFIRPLQRPFNNQTTLIPSAYDPDNLPDS